MKQVIKIRGDTYELLLSKGAILLAIKNIASKIVRDYKGKDIPTLLVVMTGANYFGIHLSEALDKLGFRHYMAYIQVSRYTKDEKPRKKIKLVSKPDKGLIIGRDVIVIEDILDKGLTLEFINSYLIGKKVKSVNYCLLGVKRGHKKLDFKIRYAILRNLGKRWLVGFGMDSNGLYRGLFGVYIKIRKVLRR